MLGRIRSKEIGPKQGRRKPKLASTVIIMFLVNLFNARNSGSLGSFFTLEIVLLPRNFYLLYHIAAIDDVANRIKRLFG